MPLTPSLAPLAERDYRLLFAAQAVSLVVHLIAGLLPLVGPFMKNLERTVYRGIGAWPTRPEKPRTRELIDQFSLGLSRNSAVGGKYLWASAIDTRRINTRAAPCQENMR